MSDINYALQYFKTVAPPNGSMIYFLEYIGAPDCEYEISAMNISTTSCGRDNIQSLLRTVETIQINFSGSLYVVDIDTREDLSTYFHMTFTDPVCVEVSSLEADLECDTGIKAGNTVTVDFINGDYNATINNANTIRKNSFIFDVDRSVGSTLTSGSVAPRNIEGILSGTAPKAPIQDSNYTIRGLVLGRYEGSKTTQSDFGTLPVLEGSVTNGALYPTSSGDLNICSQSLSDRNIQEIFYTGNFEYPESGSTVYTLEGNKAVLVRNKKLWIQDVEKIATIDPTGTISSLLYQCS